MVEISLSDINYDVALPFAITLTEGTDDDTQIKCVELIRLIPGRRAVFRAEWKNTDVFVKIFLDKNRAANDMDKERAGVKALKDRSITAPALLYSGRLYTDGACILVYESIDHAVNARDAWQEATTRGKSSLLTEFMGLLAQHHEAGLSQQDMHLSNFIIADDKLYTLDAADIKISSSALDVRDSIKNLAMFFSLLHKAYNTLIIKAYNEYSTLRKWQHPQDHVQVLQKKIENLRQYKKKKYLKKIFRECSEFVCNKSFRKYIVYDRRYDTEQFRKNINNPDHCFDEGDRNIIKRGNTCTIATCVIDHNTFVIKRYNIKNVMHACKRAFRKTRAMNSWLNAHRLIIDDIHSARPVALIENRFGPLRGKAWFIMRHVNGMSCVDYFASDTIQMDDKKIMANRIAELFEKLAMHRLGHGDMKATNIIIKNGQPVLLDLDAMREHKSDASLKRAITKDVQRFLENWEGSDPMSKIFRFSLDKLIRNMQLPVA